MSTAAASSRANVLENTIPHTSPAGRAVRQIVQQAAAGADTILAQGSSTLISGTKTIAVGAAFNGKRVVVQIIDVLGTAGAKIKAPPVAGGNVVVTATTTSDVTVETDVSTFNWFVLN